MTICIVVIASITMMILIVIFIMIIRIKIKIISLLTLSKTYPKQVAPIAMNRKERKDYDYN